MVYLENIFGDKSTGYAYIITIPIWAYLFFIERTPLHLILLILSFLANSIYLILLEQRLTAISQKFSKQEQKEISAQKMLSLSLTLPIMILGLTNFILFCLTYMYIGIDLTLRDPIVYSLALTGIFTFVMTIMKWTINYGITSLGDPMLDAIRHRQKK